MVRLPTYGKPDQDMGTASKVAESIHHSISADAEVFLVELDRPWRRIPVPLPSY
jgi:hypothetical protein